MAVFARGTESRASEKAAGAFFSPSGYAGIPPIRERATMSDMSDNVV
jgi:hypothetical protein